MSAPLLPSPLPPIVPEVEAAVRELHLADRAAEIDRSPRFPREEFRELGRRGLLGLRIPPALGGRGLPMVDVGAALYRWAYLSGTTFAKLSLQPEFSSVLAEGGEAGLIDRYFRPLVRGEVLIGNQVTEPGAGSDAQAVSLRAVRRGGDYRLTGIKSQAAFASEATAAIVFARVEGGEASATGLTAFLVPQDLPGISRRVVPDLGERWMGRGTVVYEDVLVPAEQRLGAEGRAFALLREELSRERLLLAAIYVGVARASFDEVVADVGLKATFGRPLAEHEAVSFPLVEDWALLDAAELYVRRALERAGSSPPSDAEAALAKWLATDIALRTIDHALQFSGGRGYSSELPHERRLRDVRSGALAHGTSEIMHLIAARRLWPREGPSHARAETTRA